MKLTKIEPKFIEKHNPRIGLITLASDFRIEKDFNNIIYGKDIDLFCNRIQSYNPLTNETLKKMADDIPKVVKNILPGQKIDCIAYGCTSGTIAAGYSSIYEKVNSTKPNTKVTTPITSAINALKALKINKLSIFTPYTDEINQSVINYFKKENIEITGLTYFDIASDLDIGKVNPDHLFDVLSKIDLLNSDALFVSCTALPVLSIIKDLEKKMNKIVLSSNQTLIWDTLNQIDFKSKIEGYGELFNN
ncbi:aspartate/glutamate racemase family protein [Pelagibacterales bacterium SAG-MED11]|nr:aspartate/glutamate racemase family protein [Pelagibacterales bacterium SAG-MED11]